MFKHWFCWMYQYNKYTFNFIDSYSFIPASDCVAMGPNALLYPGVYNTVKTALSKGRLLHDLSQVTDKRYHIMLYTSPWSRFELTTSVVIGTDCIGIYKSNYHTITTTMAPGRNRGWYQIYRSFVFIIRFI